VGGIVLCSSPQAGAGHPQERQGFWIGFGGGYGSAHASCDGGDGEGSYAGFIKLGGTLNQRVLLGVEANAWSKDEGGPTLTLGSFTGTVTFYPQATSGFFLKGGAGLSYVSTEFREASLSVSLDKTGWGVLAGPGDDVRVGRNISITPCVNFYCGQPGDLVFEGETIGNWKQNVISFEVGITFH
jgi:hypothetical protein